MESQNLIVASGHLLNFFDDIVCDFLARISHHLGYAITSIRDELFTRKWPGLPPGYQGKKASACLTDLFYPRHDR